MKYTQKNIVILIAIVVIAGLVLANFTGMMNISLMGTNDTINYAQYGGPDVSTVTDTSKKVFSGRGEVTQQTNYLSTWLYDGMGEKIILSPGASYWNAWWKGFFGTGTVWNQPGIIIGRYWIEATFNEGGEETKVIWAGGFDNQYLEVTQDSPTYNYLYSEFGHFGKRPWAGLYGQYKNQWGGASGTAGPTTSDGWNKWWSNPFQETYNEYVGGLTGTPVSFYMKAGRQGTMTVQVFGEYATWHQTAPWSAHYDLHERVLLQTDTFVVKSAEGDLDITASNVYKFLGGAEAGGTRDIYTKYVFQEGKEVTLNIDVDYSRPEAFKGWKVQILKPGDIPFVGKISVGGVLKDAVNGAVSIPDNVDNKLVKFTIPDGSFIKGGNNEWKVKLINPALQKSLTDTTPQAEIKLFVVDTYDHAPSDTTITTNGDTFSEGASVQITCKAYRNQITKSPITSFRIWGKLNHPRSGETLFDTSIPQSSITVRGEQYIGTYTYKTTKQGKIYIQVHAQDQKGYTGGEGLATVKVTSAPTYSIVVDVSDNSTGNPIQNAKVRLGTVEKYSRSDGSATFDVLTGQYALFVSKSGYISYDGGVLTIGSNRDISVKLSLIGGGTPAPPGEEKPSDDKGQTTGPYSIDIQVYDSSTWNIVQGAMVTFAGVSAMTDGNGVANVVVNEQGAYELTVDKAGYKPFSYQVSIEEFQTGMLWAYLTPIGGEGGEEQFLGDDDWDVDDWFINDVDGDGIGNGYDSDIDGDGIPNDVDTDADGDGIEDGTEQSPSDKYTVTVTVTNGDANTVVRMGSVSGYGSTVTLSISAGTHTLKVGRVGYQVYSKSVTIPDQTVFTITLVPIDTTPPGDIDGDGIPNNEDDDLDGDGIANDIDNDIDGDGINNKDDKQPYIPNAKTQGIPGFEMLVFIGALAVAMLILYRRKKKE